MELRQLRYFVTLAEELHFGRAAAREHIVQSALSQQVQRLERELGVRLLERSTHQVSLTVAGAVFLAEARQILAHVDRATAIARSATGAAPALRVGIIDASYDSMPQILHEVQARYPGLAIHQVEASVPEQYQQLVDGRLDVGIGRAAYAPPQVASYLFRRDPLGVLVPSGHRFAALEGVPVAVLARSRCCSPKRSRLRNSTSSPSRCAGPPGSPPPCTREPWKASARPPISSPTGAACTASLPPASPRSPEPPGGRLPNRPPTTRGRCCGARPKTPATCKPSSAARRPCPVGWAGWSPRPALLLYHDHSHRPRRVGSRLGVMSRPGSSLYRRAATGSDQTLMDIAPSPARSRLQTAGDRVVGFLVVRPGVPVG